MKKLLSILLIAISVSLNAQIVEMANFSQIKSHITPVTLVIFDIDDTLLIPKQMLGCDEWFIRRMQDHMALGLSKSGALEKTIAEFDSIRHLSQMEVVEPGTEQYVRLMQQEGYRVMGLTMQGLALATRTWMQLAENGIDLSVTSPHKGDEAISVNGHMAVYRKGILFASGTPKGQALFVLLEKIGYFPKRIVFVDDKAANLQEVERVAEQKGVEFVGLRYGYSDAKRKAYDHGLATFQFTNSNFSHILTDFEAKAMKKEAPVE